MDYQLFKKFAAHASGSYLPVLGDAHVYETVSGNRAQIGNGRYWVDIPCELPVMSVNADRLAAALLSCKGVPKVTLKDNTVTISTGRIRARMTVSGSEYPITVPDPPDTIALPGVVDVLRRLQPFVAEDASRPWATSICLSGEFAYVTNNVAVARYPLPHPVNPPVNIPGSVIDAVLERGEAIAFGHTDRSVTFYYEDGAWVRTLLTVGDWPTATVDGLVEPLFGGTWEPIHEDLEEMLQTANKLSPERNPVVSFNGSGLELVDGSFAADDLLPVPEAGRVSAKMAALIFGIATHVQWHRPRQDVHGFCAGALTGVMGGTR